MKTRRESLVAVAQHLFVSYLFRYGGNISAALILGGVDDNGAHLCGIQPHGSFSYLPYATLGSGSLAAQSVLDTGFSSKMTEEAAQDLAVRAIEAGVLNDLGSGSNIDVCIIRKDRTTYIRSVKKTGTESAGKMNIV